MALLISVAIAEPAIPILKVNINKGFKIILNTVPRIMPVTDCLAAPSALSSWPIAKLHMVRRQPITSIFEYMYVNSKVSLFAPSKRTIGSKNIRPIIVTIIPTTIQE